MKFISTMYIPPWVGKKFRFAVCRLLENVFSSLEFTICTAGIIKKLSTPISAPNPGFSTHSIKNIANSQGEPILRSWQLSPF